MTGNPIKGEVGFTADAEPYILVFTIDALCKVEGLLGVQNQRQAQVKLTGGSLEAMRAFFWAGLQEHHPDLSVRDAGELMLAVDDMDKGAAGLIAEALELANPKARKAAKEKGAGGAAKPDPQPTTAGIGTTSSPDGANSV